MGGGGRLCRALARQRPVVRRCCHVGMADPVAGLTGRRWPLDRAASVVVLLPCRRFALVALRDRHALASPRCSSAAPRPCARLGPAATSKALHPWRRCSPRSRASSGELLLLRRWRLGDAVTSVTPPLQSPATWALLPRPAASSAGLKPLRRWRLGRVATLVAPPLQSPASSAVPARAHCQLGRIATSTAPSPRLSAVRRYRRLGVVSSGACLPRWRRAGLGRPPRRGSAPGSGPGRRPGPARRRTR